MLSSGSGSPPFFIPALCTIGILVHKQATRIKHFCPECIIAYYYWSNTVCTEKTLFCVLTLYKGLDVQSSIPLITQGFSSIPLNDERAQVAFGLFINPLYK